jgi:mono/diheme cytochrome c family protein
MKSSLLKSMLLFAILGLTVGVLAARTATAAPRPAEPAAGGADGKAVFLAQKCSLCHSVQSAGIDRTVKSSKAPDLSNVGGEKDAAWIGKFLKKEVELNGKPHQKTFKGSDAEFNALVAWLSQLKAHK